MLALEVASLLIESRMVIINMQTERMVQPTWIAWVSIWRVRLQRLCFTHHHRPPTPEPVERQRGKRVADREHELDEAGDELGLEEEWDVSWVPCFWAVREGTYPAGAHADVLDEDSGHVVHHQVDTGPVRGLGVSGHIEREKKE